MSKFYDGMGNDLTNYVLSLQEGQEKLKASELKIIQLEAEVKRLKKLKKVTE